MVPDKLPALTAAPSATTSSGSTKSNSGFLENVFSTNFLTQGVFVAPPTNNTLSNGRPADLVLILFLLFFLFFASSICLRRSKFTPALSAHSTHGCRIRRKTLVQAFSNICLVNATSFPSGGKGTFTTSTSDSFSLVLLAFNNAPLKSTINPFLSHSLLIHFATATSKSSPPNLESPPVANTSNVPPPTSKIDTSNVPPPKSKTKIVSSKSGFMMSTPYAKAAASGSLNVFTTFKPAIIPASMVASTCV